MFVGIEFSDRRAGRRSEAAVAVAVELVAVEVVELMEKDEPPPIPPPIGGADRYSLYLVIKSLIPLKRKIPLPWHPWSGLAI